MPFAIAGLFGATVLARLALAQPARTSAPNCESAIADLAHIDDFSFSYAQPGFYGVLECVRRTGVAKLDGADSLSIADWKELLERSADYRGRSVEIEGIVGRNTAWKPLDERQRSLGTVWELQLQRDDQPLICKCILVGDVGDIPLGARVRLAGVYIMIHQYYSESKRMRQAALLVGVGPTSVSHDAPRAPSPAGNSSIVVIAALAGGLALAWFLLRRHAGVSPVRDRHTLRAEHRAPLSLADDLAAWAESESAAKPPDGPDRG
jgi:hypothetical protein